MPGEAANGGGRLPKPKSEGPRHQDMPITPPYRDKAAATPGGPIDHPKYLIYYQIPAYTHTYIIYTYITPATTNSTTSVITNDNNNNICIYNSNKCAECIST